MEHKDSAERKRSLKKFRTRQFFLDAAKKMIIEEGVENVSVRKVADKAGYSYVTLYNNFADLNELLWYVKQDMIEDMGKRLLKEAQSLNLDLAGINKIFRLYITYYLKHLHVFKFFYFHKVVKPATSDDESDKDPDFDALTRNTFSGLVLHGVLQEQDVEIVAKAIVYAVHGMLMLYVSGNGDLTEDKLLKEIDQILDYLLT